MKFFYLILLTILSLNLFSQQGYVNKTLGLKKKFNGNDENGYVLFSPMNSDTTYLINKCGKKVHQWVTKTSVSLSSYILPNGDLLKTGFHSDTSNQTAGGKGGYVEKYDWNSNLLWQYEIFNDSFTQHHDIEPLPNGNVLVLAWHHINQSKAISLGRNPINFQQNVSFNSALWGETVFELKPVGKDSAEIVWQWNLFDHVIQDYDTLLPNFGVVADHPELMNINYALNLKTYDWIHANSVSYNYEKNQIILSCHNISEFWIIDHSTTTQEAASHTGGNFNMGGDLLYRWGNPEAYNRGTAQDRVFYKQHNAHWIPQGYADEGKIMVFNNGLGRPDTLFSSVDIVEIPDLSNNAYKMTLPYGPVGLSWRYTDSVKRNFYSPVISGAHRMPNGNTMICSGVPGTFFEINQNKKIVWEYKNPQNGNILLADGSTNNASVFRCTFYPDTFIAFKNKTLTLTTAIEANSRPYTCNYETNAPTLLGFNPSQGQLGVLPNSNLSIEFNEGILKRLGGTIRVYSNGNLIETINVTSNRVWNSGNNIVIDPVNNLPVNSAITVSVTASSFRDSSFNNYSPDIKVNEWYFTTVTSKPEISRLLPSNQSTNISTSVNPQIIFKNNIFKRNIGNVYLYEKNQLKQTISIQSNAINIKDSIVTIIPNVQFQNNSFIHVAFDSCFIDDYGIVSENKNYGDWFFKTKNSPQAINFSPIHKQNNVSVTASVFIEFDKNIIADTVKSVEMFVNNEFEKQLNIKNSGLKITNNKVEFNYGDSLKYESEISFFIPFGMFFDSENEYFEGFDTSKWSFNTIRNTSYINPKIKDYYFNIYPNPSSNTIFLNTDFEINTIQVFDIFGKEVLINFNENDNFIDISLLSHGVYNLLLNNELQTLFVKN